MRKVYALITVSFFVSCITVTAQSEKKELAPPPPPKPKTEVTKFTPPKIVKDEEVQMKAPAPPPQKPMSETVIDEKIKVVQPVKPMAEIKTPPVITIKGELAGAFYKRNPTIMNVSRQGNIVTLKMKDGSTEKYDLSKKEENKKFTEKYGACPIPPPPKVVKEVKLS